MNFLTYLNVYEKEDTKQVEKIIENENEKINAILKEAFFGEFVSKTEAKIKIKNEFTDKNKVPKTVDCQFVNENINKIEEKIDTLTEGDIKIIIHNNEASNAPAPVVSLPIPMDGQEMPCEEKKKKRGRPKKKVDEFENKPDEKYKEEEVVEDLIEKDEEKVDEKCGSKKKKKVEEDEEVIDEKKVEDDEEVIDEKKKKVKDDGEELSDEKKDEDDEEELPIDEIPVDDDGGIKWSDIEDKLDDIEDKLDTLIDNEDDEKKSEDDEIPEKEDDNVEEEIEEEISKKKIAEEMDELIEDYDTSLLIDGASGIYIPKEFIESYEIEAWGIKPEDAKTLLQGPDAEYYWETWDDVISYAEFTDEDGRKWTLHQDGDLFAVSEKLEDIEENTEYFYLKEEQDKYETKVIFRMWKVDDSEELIALFPEELGDSNPKTCSSYQHVGQHGAATPDMIVDNSRSATPEEYEDLKNELENNVGYKLEIVSDESVDELLKSSYEIRRKKLEKYEDVNGSKESLKESKLKSVDIGDGYYVKKVGNDTNGNSSVWVSKGANKAKKIQMNGVVKDKSNVMTDKLKYFENNKNTKVKKSIKEIKDYYKKYIENKEKE